jgi:hypothetical protein
MISSQALSKSNQAPPQAPPSDAVSESSSHSSRSAWRQALTVGAALFAAISLGYFVWQNDARHDSAVQQTNVAAASVGLRGTPQSSVAIPDAAVQETPVATAPIGTIETSQTTVAVQEANSPSGNFILASQAQAYIGQYKQVCGHIAGSKELPAGLFISFDRPYPNEVMTAVIWREHLNRIGHFPTEGQRVCISGIIQAYRGKPQIEVERREQISP